MHFGGTAITINIPAIKRNLFFQNCCPIAENCCSQKRIDMVGVEHELPRIIHEFSFNLWSIHGYLCSQKTSCSALSMLSSIFQRPHVIRRLFPFDNAKLLHPASDFKPIHSRSKTVQKPWIFRPVSFTPVHARSKVLWKYVQAPLGRTSLHPNAVRPYTL